MKNPYEVMGVDRDVSPTELKNKYRQLAKKYHPDLNQGSEDASEKLKDINEAYSILSDPEKKDKYDRFGEAAFDQAGGYSTDFSGFGDIFGDIFGDFFGGGSRSRRRDPNAPVSGEDIQLNVKITFKESMAGVEKKVSYRKNVNCSHCHGSGGKNGARRITCSTCGGSGFVQTTTRSPFGQFMSQSECPKCHGSGSMVEEKCEHCHGSGREFKNVTLNVKIPKGVDKGNVIPLRNQGHEGVNGGPNGDLYIVIEVENHEIFQRHGNDIYLEMPISYVTAALGDEIEVPTIGGYEKFKIPAGTQTSTRFKIRNQGAPDVRSGRKGDLYFDVKIVVPKGLNKDQREKLMAYGDSIGNRTSKDSKNFFEKLKDFFNE